MNRSNFETINLKWDLEFWQKSKIKQSMISGSFIVLVSYNLKKVS